MPGTLYLVATPIGNLGDLTLRGAEILKSVDFIAAEDTRVTLKLLNHLTIKKPVVSYYEHNKQESGEKIVSRILSGENCALVSDAGTPAISDPGEDLVRQCAENGIVVFPVPGPCAAISALSVSGLPTGRFVFEGFLSRNKKSRIDRLAELKGESRTMIFYEAPHKLTYTLKDMYAVWGERQISLSREITKIHEETVRTTLSEAVARYDAEPPRGEFVLIIEGAAETHMPQITIEEAIKRVLKIRESGVPLKEAARQTAADTGFSKNELYAEALKK